MINFSLLKNSPELFKVVSATVYCHANPYISLIAQREHIEIEISNSVQVFLVLISFPYYFYVQKSNGSIGSVGSAGSKGSTSSTGSEV